MELKLDRNKTYGLALEGGGAKGAYQIGAWKALREADIRFSAVSGTSVGALNGAMIVMDDLEKAENVWNNIHFSQVMDVDDEEMRRLMNRDIPLSELKSTLRSVADIVRNRGFDVTPLRNWVAEVVDADKICHSDTDFFIVTYSLSDHQELELKASDLDKDELCDMLLASAYLPAFRLEKLGGKYYADGGVQDVVPIHALVENGCKDIIALRIFGFGIEKRFRIPDDVHVTTIGPTVDLGNILNFDAELDVQDNVTAMTASLSTVTTMQVTYAARNSDFDGHDIHEGDYLGLCDGALLAVTPDLTAILTKMAEKTGAEDHSFINIFYGCDISEADAEAARDIFAAHAPDAEINLLSGGQPIYYYLISAE